MGSYLQLLPQLVPEEADIDWTRGWVWSGALTVDCGGLWERSYLVAYEASVSSSAMVAVLINCVLQSFVAKGREKVSPSDTSQRSLPYIQPMAKSGLPNLIHLKALQ